MKKYLSNLSSYVDDILFRVARGLSCVACLAMAVFGSLLTWLKSMVRISLQTTNIFKPCVFYVSIFFSRNTVLKL